MRLTVLPAALTVLLLTACQQETANNPEPPAATVRSAASSQTTLLQGQSLFMQHCAACHGKQAEGAPGWHKALPDGSWPPPPLNGTAHTWHHPQAVLVDVIRNGTAATGGKMPAWKDKLTDREIEAIIVWFQSLWPAEILKVWQDINRRALQQSP